MGTLGKQECLSKLILFGEGLLRSALQEFVEHYHRERNHQGKANVLLFPAESDGESRRQGAIRCRERLVGCSNTTAEPHEYFDNTRFASLLAVRKRHVLRNE